MTVTPDLDAPRPAREESFSDALTIAFADPANGAGWGTTYNSPAGGTAAR